MKILDLLFPKGRSADESLLDTFATEDGETSAEALQSLYGVPSTSSSGTEAAAPDQEPSMPVPDGEQPPDGQPQSEAASEVVNADADQLAAVETLYGLAPAPSAASEPAPEQPSPSVELLTPEPTAESAEQPAEPQSAGADGPAVEVAPAPDQPPIVQAVPGPAASLGEQSMEPPLAGNEAPESTADSAEQAVEPQSAGADEPAVEAAPAPDQPRIVQEAPGPAASLVERSTEPPAGIEAPESTAQTVQPSVEQLLADADEPPTSPGLDEPVEQTSPGVERLATEPGSDPQAVEEPSVVDPAAVPPGESATGDGLADGGAVPLTAAPMNAEGAILEPATADGEPADGSEPAGTVEGADNADPGARPLPDEPTTTEAPSSEDGYDPGDSGARVDDVAAVVTPDVEFEVAVDAVSVVGPDQLDEPRQWAASEDTVDRPVEDGGDGPSDEPTARDGDPVRPDLGASSIDASEVDPQLRALLSRISRPDANELVEGLLTFSKENSESA